LSIERVASTATSIREIGLLASRSFALEFALGTSAVCGFGTLVVAFELFAYRAALGFGCGASGVALGRGTDSLALRAVLLLAEILGAADRASGTLAVDDALGALNLFTLHFALGAPTHRVAHSGASRIVALPFALRMALGLFGADSGEGENAQSKNENGTHLFFCRLRLFWIERDRKKIGYR
jgi:hypothetical protein